MKWYVEYEMNYKHNQMVIKVATIDELNRRAPYEKAKNTLSALKLYDSLEECKQSLKHYSKSVLLPNGNIL